jgi:hypothetical protein
VYTQNLWVFLDVIFSILFTIYFIIRLHALRISDEEDSVRWARTSLDVLSCAAPVLIPRLAFNIMSENVLFLSLRAMMADFLTLTLLAVWSFAGFLLSLKWLHNGIHQVSSADSVALDLTLSVCHNWQMDDLDLVRFGWHWH